jgi:hypothetical protein
MRKVNERLEICFVYSFPDSLVQTETIDKISKEADLLRRKNQVLTETVHKMEDAIAQSQQRDSNSSAQSLQKAIGLEKELVQLRDQLNTLNSSKHELYQQKDEISSKLILEKDITVR